MKNTFIYSNINKYIKCITLYICEIPCEMSEKNTINIFVNCWPVKSTSYFMNKITFFFKLLWWFLNFFFISLANHKFSLNCKSEIWKIMFYYFFTVQNCHNLKKEVINTIWLEKVNCLTIFQSIFRCFPFLVTTAALQFFCTLFSLNSICEPNN